eukprot:TRINITY_DN6721_c3_g1_i1.p1 TRINITY_DN6721_c3_g1~~TRINITY_DN6721_c3_g1_i1.p1  ORF type:complete len:157 (+),score=31.21 TRINITY_DN6721_c3_g1_i1:686-1156(+)
MEEVFEGVRAAFAYNTTTRVSNAVGLSAAITATIEAVDWQEPWLLYVLAVHVSLWISLILSRANPKALAVLGASIVTAVHSHTLLNTFAQKNWKSFSRRNYFDPDCVLIRIIWTTPLLITAFSVLVYALVDVTIQARNRPPKPYRPRPVPFPRKGA